MKLSGTQSFNASRHRYVKWQISFWLNLEQNRKNRVNAKNVKSAYKCRVRQDQSLDPRFHWMFINGLPDYVECATTAKCTLVGSRQGLYGSKQITSDMIQYNVCPIIHILVLHDAETHVWMNTLNKSNINQLTSLGWPNNGSPFHQQISISANTTLSVGLLRQELFR